VEDITEITHQMLIKIDNMNDVKDSVANIATVVGPSGYVMGWNEVLTVVLILTGIVLNLVRIYEIKRRKDKE